MLNKLLANFNLFLFSLFSRKRNLLGRVCPLFRSTPDSLLGPLFNSFKTILSNLKFRKGTDTSNRILYFLSQLLKTYEENIGFHFVDDVLVKV